MSLKIEQNENSEIKSFDLINRTLTKEEAVAEASRCLLCDELCDICTTVCPNAANYSYKTESVEYQMQKAIFSSAENYSLIDTGKFEVKQKNQVLNIGNWCNECGNCSIFCPTSGDPYKDKPKFYLTAETFNQEKSGYFIEKIAGYGDIRYQCRRQYGG